MDIQKIYLPTHRAKPMNIIRNCLYVNKHRSKKEINHVTGDAHYIAYFLKKSRTIITVHDIVGFHNLKGIKKYIWNLLYIQVLKRVEKVVFISEYTKNDVLQYIDLVKEKYEVIPNPLPERFKQKLKLFNNDKPIILQIGTKANKNIFRLIKALKGVNCHLRIIGNLNDDIVSNLISNRIDYSNKVNLTDKEILDEYENCDIVNFISTFEGFGMPIIEGQAIGRVVITSKIEPMIDVAGKGAYLVNPYDINSIRKAYLFIIDDLELRNKLISEGFENIKRFKTEAICQKYMEIYKSLEC